MNRKLSSCRLRLLVCCILLFLFSANQPLDSFYTGIGRMTGNDGKTYKTVRIGNQIWMVENLRETRYRDGSLIHVVTDNNEWKEQRPAGNIVKGGRCAYNNDDELSAFFGYLYNWYAVIDFRRTITPPGWRLPSDADWQILIDHLRGAAEAGGKMKTAGTSFWRSPNAGATNESGFSALPGGFRHDHGRFSDLGSTAGYWSLDRYARHDRDNANSVFLSYDHPVIVQGKSDMLTGLSVRLIKE